VALPFSNIAWRVGVSSAVAGALTAGVLALMVSRGGTMILEGIAIFKRLPRKEENWLRVVSGYVAGMAFGFSDPFWFQAVVAEVWPLSMLLGTLVVYFCLSLVLVFFLNPAPDRQSLGLKAAFFSASYLLLALWTGYGLMVLGTVLARPPANQLP
jgi:hypothetical protein